MALIFSVFTHLHKSDFNLRVWTLLESTNKWLVAVAEDRQN